MHTIIYRLKDFWQTVTMNEFARQLGLHPEQLRRNKLDYTDEHKKLLQEYYDDWKFQVEYCYEKYKGGTKFYGPSRKIKGQNCADYVKDRFVLDE